MAVGPVAPPLPVDPDELVDYVYGILWSLVSTSPPFFAAQAAALGITTEQHLGLFVGDCVAQWIPNRYVLPAGLPAGSAPDAAVVKRIVYENLLNSFVHNVAQVTAAAQQNGMTHYEMSARILPNRLMKYLVTLTVPAELHTPPNAHANPTTVNAATVATADALFLYVLQHIPNFHQVRLLGQGTAYHYTTFVQMTAANVLGAPVSPNLDQTQHVIPSPPAQHDPGAVFGYENQNDAVQEGGGIPVKQLDYSAAVQADHSQEVAQAAPPTIIIINRQITAVT